MNLSRGLPRRKFEIFPWELACLLGVLFLLVVRFGMGDPVPDSIWRGLWGLGGGNRPRGLGI
jgi:hypothetical protein